MLPLGHAALVIDLFLGARGSQLIISATAEAGAGMHGMDSVLKTVLTLKLGCVLASYNQRPAFGHFSTK